MHLYIYLYIGDSYIYICFVLIQLLRSYLSCCSCLIIRKGLEEEEEAKVPRRVAMPVAGSHRWRAVAAPRLPSCGAYAVVVCTRFKFSAYIMDLCSFFLCFFNYICLLRCIYSIYVFYIYSYIDDSYIHIYMYIYIYM